MSARERLNLIASGAFVVGYLAIQGLYPAIAWFLPEVTRFTWHMYSGRHDIPHVSVTFADGSRRDLGDLRRRDSPVRVLGSSVDVSRFAPLRLCAIWHDVRAVHLRDARGHERIVTCPEHR